MSSLQPRKQRKARYDAPLHVRRKQMAAHLSEELLLKYNRRSFPVISGDTVKVLRGSHRGTDGKVVEIDTKARKVVVEGVTHKKADGTDVALPVDPSNLLITKLNLEDARRRDKLEAGSKEESS
ncbi:MAG: 50S ribosomal protein L24 [Thermoplasmatota archaeon]